MGKLYFEIIADKPKRKGFSDVQRLMIGRVQSSDIHIDHPDIENVHAMIEVDELKGMVRITDVSGTPVGVAINGALVKESAIAAGDRVQLGPITCVLYFEGQRPKDLQPLEINKKIPPPPPPVAKNVPKPKKVQELPEEDEEKAVSATIEHTVVTISAPMPRTTHQGEVVEISQIQDSAVLDVSTFKLGQCITIGDSLSADYLSGLPSIRGKKKVPFVESHKSGMSVHIDLASMRGAIRTKGKVYTLDEAKKSGALKEGGLLGHILSLAKNDYCKLLLEGTTYFICMVPRPDPLKQSAFFEPDPIYRRALGVVAALWLVIAIAIPFLPLGAEEVIEEEAEKVFQKVLVKPKRPKPKPEVVKRFNLAPKAIPQKAKPSSTKSTRKLPPKKKPARIGSGDEGQGQRRAGKEGKRGRRTAKGRSKGVTVHKRSKRKIVSPFQQGLLGAVTTSDVSARLTTLVSKGGRFDKTLKGTGSTDLVDGKGVEGEGLRGTGLGGGGKSAHISGLGTQGRGAGRKGFGTGTVLGKGNSRVLAPGEGTVVQGQLSKEAIRKVVQAHLGELRGCYQFYLNQYPKLSGNIVLSWVILENGNVFKKSKVVSASWRYAKGKLVLNKLLNCMASKIATWKFPSPRGGVVVVKAYPFNFFYE